MRHVIAFCRRWWPILTGLGLAAITALSLAPLPELPLPDPVLSDKLHHAVAYALLVLPIALARPRGWWRAAPAFLAWSAAIELAQPLLNRHADWIDLGANGAGIAFGVALAAALRHAARPA